VTPKIWFADFWPGFEPSSCYLYRLLALHHGAVLSEEPEYLVYSVFGRAHLDDPRYDRCVKILWTGESVSPDFSVCDYALSHDYGDDPRNLRWPIYVERLAQVDRVPGSSLLLASRPVQAPRSRFCCRLVSNGGCAERNDFFHLLSCYRQVDSGGAHLNNIGYRVPDGDKMSHMSQYKFALAFESCSRPGYVTEKLADALLAGCVPIYWGSPRVADDFDPRSFINLHDCGSRAEAVRRVVEADRSDAVLERYLGAPRLPGDRLTDYCRPSRVIDFFAKIFADREPRLRGRVPLARTVGLGWSRTA